ncbi:Tyrosine-protein kinase Src64B-like Protein [Tribolium castaneum]|uniref:non-specific serine/threonine protein kinase n=1 Tax=Tribolium castaneum TaxID=7070 RepID=A0A139WMU8_TRICA|nr:PREDICTED: serine/threonine-protein kinase mos [Tribolium castaneum]KYB29300.1 Tyrosine-protein kinase Src64B-like Protein [Tribolium castaneum]|eukprot:XP_008201578.1 PREDICTED: serine/threonine-protein kinase mos [Tribolium castaneum]
MSTPIKSASSLLLNARLVSPKLLSPVENKICYTSTPKRVPRQSLNFSHDFQAHNPVKNPIQIKVTQENLAEDSLIIDSPHKSELLTYGLNKYDLLYILGKGSFGTVIKGNYHGKIVAVKLIKSKSGFVNESNALNLRHENIITVFDIIVSRKYSLVMMEYHEDSKNLQSVIDDASAVLDRKTVVRFSKDVASGLKHCHENGVLHLDIKPKNILLCDNKVCKICDFGNSVKASKATEMCTFQGTVPYTAPEILRGKLPSTKSDIYSLGILIWQMIYRKSPYEFSNSEVIIYKVVKFNFRPPLDSKDEVLARLCCLCWDESSNKRPSAAQICDLLNGVVFNEK